MNNKLPSAFLMLLLCFAAGCQNVSSQEAMQQERNDQFFKADPNADFAGSHILVAYKGAQRAGEQITRSKEEAEAKARQLIDLLKSDPSKFEETARNESDGPSAAQAGSLGAWTKGRMVPEFDAAIELLEVGEITSEPVETGFGYHVIRRDSLAVEHFGMEGLVIGYKGAPRAPATASRSQQEAQALCQEIKSTINGQNFADMVKEHSDGGDQPIFMGVLTKNDPAPPEILQAVTGLEVGQVAGPLEMPFGYAFVRRTRLEQRAGAHILIAYQGAMRSQATRSKEEALQKANDILAQVQQNPSLFAELAKQNSDGPSGPNGGDLGVWFKGKMVSEFDEALGQLQPGEIYPQAVETAFGYHILLRKAVPE
ncbi:MAG TPA: peptidylprolyl isomerase [Acidobacteriota bacterium]|nr:peptidylprolyl isomerase [Acidobacteriota bacterium]